MSKIPIEAGNDIVKDPYLVRNIEEEHINEVNTEAAYFAPSNGNRTVLCCEYGFCRHDSQDT